MDTTAKQLLSFIKASPTCFHAVWNIAEMLKQAGYQELSESDAWQISAGGKYYVTRNQSSIIALHIGEDISDYSFNIVASHSDSPSFKVKEHAQIEVCGKYAQLNTEGYGGMLCATWMDRPLSLAGRAFIKTQNGFVSKLVNIDRDLLLIPSVAIHMNREANQGYAYNKQIDLLPLLGGEDTDKDAYRKMIAAQLGVSLSDIYGLDLFLYNRCAPSVWGANQEYISAPQLDDLECAYTSLQGFISGHHPQSVGVYACFDNEEVGSTTKQGAASTFLADILRRMNHALGKSEEDYHRALGSSFMISADNAHALHPNHPEKSDRNHRVYMNEGIVIKSNAAQKYTSDAISIALFRSLCEQANVKIQYFANRSDMMGGSTLGNIAQTQVSLHCVDIGLPQLAMHSCYETAGIYDIEAMIKVITAFFDTHFHQVDSVNIEMKRR